eukprot:gene257-466_t
MRKRYRPNDGVHCLFLFLAIFILLLPLAFVRWRSIDESDDANNAYATTGALLSTSRVVVTYSEATIARDSDGISKLGLSDRSRLTVFAILSNGESKDVTVDSRTKYAVVNGSDIVEIESTESRVSIWAPDDRVGHGYATIRVAYTTSLARWTYDATISVVERTSFTVIPYAYPSHETGDPLEKTIVRRVHCDYMYQRLRLIGRVGLSNGSMYDVTKDSFFSTSADIYLQREADVVVLVAGQSGNYNVSATWDQLVSQHTSVLVTDEPARVTSLQHTTNWTMSDFGQTFYDLVNSEKVLSLEAHFDDGTVFQDVVNGVQSAWLRYGRYMVFASDRAESIDVNAEGVAILSDNHHTQVEIKARTVCDDTTVDTVENSTLVFANLKAGTNDVELGKNEGSQFESVVVGEKFSVPVFLQTGDAQLKLYDVRLRLVDSQTLRATDCEIGDDWMSMTFSCTINDPVDEVMIVGSEPNSTASGLVHIATVTFETLSTATGSARINGSVYAMGTSNSAMDINADEISAPAIVAGNGEVLIRRSSGRRLTLIDPRSPKLGHWPDQFVERSRWTQRFFAPNRLRRKNRVRRGSTRTISVRGDVDMNGKFNAWDVHVLQKWIRDEADATKISSMHQQTLDPVLWSLSFSNDTSYCPRGWSFGLPCATNQGVEYMLCVHTRRCRWVDIPGDYAADRFVYAAAGNISNLTFFVRLANDINDGFLDDGTRVSFEIGTVEPTKLKTRRSSNHSLSSTHCASDLFTFVARYEEGVYTVTTEDVFQYGCALSLSMTTTTYDAYGNTADDRIWNFQRGGNGVPTSIDTQSVVYTYVVNTLSCCCATIEYISDSASLNIITQRSADNWSDFTIDHRPSEDCDAYCDTHEDAECVSFCDADALSLDRGTHAFAVHCCAYRFADSNTDGFSRDVESIGAAHAVSDNDKSIGASHAVADHITDGNTYADSDNDKSIGAAHASIGASHAVADHITDGNTYAVSDNDKSVGASHAVADHITDGNTYAVSDNGKSIDQRADHFAHDISEYLITHERAFDHSPAAMFSAAAFSSSSSSLATYTSSACLQERLGSSVAYVDDSHMFLTQDNYQNKLVTLVRIDAFDTEEVFSDESARNYPIAAATSMTVKRVHGNDTTEEEILFVGIDGKYIRTYATGSGNMETVEQDYDYYIYATASHIVSDHVSALFLVYDDRVGEFGVVSLYQNRDMTYSSNILVSIVYDQSSDLRLAPLQIETFDFDMDGDLDLVIRWNDGTGCD